MKLWWQRWRPALKVVFVLAILASVGWQLARDLLRLDLNEVPLQPGWLALCALLYLAGLGFSALFWYRLLRAFGQRPPLLATARAYYVGQLGKYLPGKAWALLLRASLVRSSTVSLGAAGITAFYEVLTTMAAGALLAAVLFAWQPPVASGLDWSPVALGLILLALVGVPLLPGVFNLLVARVAARFPAMEVADLPPLRVADLVQGLGITACTWWMFGLSLWALLQGLMPEPPEMSSSLWARFTALVALPYVAGFLALFMPGGLGVREGLLLAFLSAELVGAPEGIAALAVLLLRVVWTVAEVALAGMLYATKGWFSGGS
jgi:uncharacterized membrane protein YbhN (UPF0104 family)